MKVVSIETRNKMSEAAKKRCTSEWKNNLSVLYSTKLDLEKIESVYHSGMTQTEIAQQFGVSQKVIWRFMKNNGIKARIAFKRNQTGASNHSWKGGKSTDEHGYVLIRYPEHPRAHKNGYVFEHILVAEKMIGRSLVFLGVDHPDSEIVHHKNENKEDNDPENLAVMTFSTHVKLHNDLRRGGGLNAKGK